ncbi:MAG: L,D-transpeptidase [Patescibacteria group bacterium]
MNIALTFTATLAIAYLATTPVSAACRFDQIDSSQVICDSDRRAPTPRAERPYLRPMPGVSAWPPALVRPEDAVRDRAERVARAAREVDIPVMPDLKTAVPGTVFVAFLNEGRNGTFLIFEHGVIAERDGYKLFGPMSHGRVGFRTPLTDPKKGPHPILSSHELHISKSHPIRQLRDGTIERGGGRMPYAMFFTNEGHALHGGDIASESAGCIRLDPRVAEFIFRHFKSAGLTVVVVESYAAFGAKWNRPYAAFLATPRKWY